ncbi:cache domain-containing protein [Moritella viscosa]
MRYLSKVSHEEQEKISYSKYFSPWGWVYGEGMYINDVDKSILNILTSN